MTDDIKAIRDALPRQKTDQSGDRYLFHDGDAWESACHPERIARLLDALELALKDAERYRWLAARLLAADFDYNGGGALALVFELPDGCAISADCNATIDAAMKGAA